LFVDIFRATEIQNLQAAKRLRLSRRRLKVDILSAALQNHPARRCLGRLPIFNRIVNEKLNTY
jgi:hypothetical protein